MLNMSIKNDLTLLGRTERRVREERAIIRMSAAF